MKLRISGFLKRSAPTIIFASIVACGPGKNSTHKVVNGSLAKDDAYPEVFAFYSASPTHPNFCTAVLVGPSVLLTAAHCVYGSEAFHINFVGETFQAQSIVVNQNFSFRDNNGVNGKDLAVITLDVELDVRAAEIYLGPVEKGLEVTIVGFGLNDNITNIGGGRKRIGKNSLISVKDTLGILGSAQNSTGNGNKASTGKGDSGGPLYIDGKVAGITTGGATVGLSSFSSYVNLNSPESRRFLKSQGL